MGGDHEETSDRDGGHRRRTEIARAPIHDPAVLPVFVLPVFVLPVFVRPVFVLTGLTLGALGRLISSTIRQLENFAGVTTFVIFPKLFLSTARDPPRKMAESSPLPRDVCAANPFPHAVEAIRFALCLQWHGPAPTDAAATPVAMRRGTLAAPASPHPAGPPCRMRTAVRIPGRHFDPAAVRATLAATGTDGRLPNGSCLRFALWPPGPAVTLPTPPIDRDALLARLLATAAGGRRIVAVAGAPGSGKSTLAEALVEGANAARPGFAALLPMDGFHYDDRVLEARGLRPRKGAPETFDTGGLDHTLARLAARDEEEVAVPVFDRGIEIARAGARLIPRSAELIVAEGNYLLLDAEPWRRLHRHFGLTVFLDVPEDVLRARLTERWRHFGLSPEAIEAKLEENDLPNGRLVRDRSLRPDFRVAG